VGEHESEALVVHMFLFDSFLGFFCRSLLMDAGLFNMSVLMHTGLLEIAERFLFKCRS